MGRRAGRFFPDGDFKQGRRWLIAGVAAVTAVGIRTGAKWAKPVVDTVVLPAHARTSSDNEPEDMSEAVIVDIVLSAPTLEFGGPPVPDSTVNNLTGATLSGLVIHAWIEQGAAERAAGGPTSAAAAHPVVIWIPVCVPTIL